MRGRFYSPAWHRFMNSDQGVDPNSINQVAYVNGNPLMGTDPTGYLDDHQLAMQENAKYRSDYKGDRTKPTENERRENVQDEIEHPERTHAYGAEKYTDKDIDDIIKDPVANRLLHRALKDGIKISAINYPGRIVTKPWEGNYRYSIIPALAEIFGKAVMAQYAPYDPMNANYTFARPYESMNIPTAQALSTARSNTIEWGQYPSTDPLGLFGWGDNGWRLSSPDDMLNFVDAAKVPSWP